MTRIDFGIFSVEKPVVNGEEFIYMYSADTLHGLADRVKNLAAKGVMLVVMPIHYKRFAIFVGQRSAEMLLKKGV